MKKRSLKFYWQLFTSTFGISAFTVGGGFVIVPLLKAKYVDEYGWISEKEALDMVAIAQTMPGVIAANSTILLGYRIAGIAGAATALCGTVLPCLITLTLISYCYSYIVTNPYIDLILRGMQCGATAIIGNVAWNLFYAQWEKKFLLPLLIIIVTCIANLFFHVPIMALLGIDALVGLFLLRDPKYN